MLTPDQNLIGISQLYAYQCSIKISINKLFLYLPHILLIDKLV